MSRSNARVAGVRLKSLMATVNPPAKSPTAMCSPMNPAPTDSNKHNGISVTQETSSLNERHPRNTNPHKNNTPA